MIAYWDASAFVILYLDLPGRPAVESVFRSADLNLLSKLTLLESFLAITSMASRGQISVADARQATARLKTDQRRLGARTVDGTLRGAVLDKYLALLERHWTLGTNDVIHLTTAAAWKNELRRKVTVVTRDAHLAAAARRERLEVEALAWRSSRALFW